ncbi:hypothetical protein [Pedobacter sp. SYSU D00535]|uniref:hypothetical protein n=1 Tax=Pedobacter sp. SYSU D00535 TaxID=2810308 RepID=UPI001A972F7F|nr:hypothetical protein [Pedobacter sp. SYSU D00535]
MKQLNFLTLCILAIPLLFFAFTPEKYKDNDPNELLYSEQAIKRLQKEIELKNASFRADVPASFLSVPQGTAAYLSIKGDGVAQIKKLIDGGSRWQQVSALLKAGERADSIYFIKIKTEKGVSFYPLELNRENWSSVDTKVPDHYDQDLTGSWVYSHYPRTSYSNERLVALFIRKELRPKLLPQAAAACIRYADHLIDTNSSIFTKAGNNTFRGFTYGNNPMVDRVLKLAHSLPGKPEWKANVSETNRQNYEQQYNDWEANRKADLEQKLSKTEEFQTALTAAYKEVIANDTASHLYMNEFETYVEKYLSPAAALDLKRRRVVVGACSMDQSPIMHAANIARLAGETCCMEIPAKKLHTWHGWGPFKGICT